MTPIVPIEAPNAQSSSVSNQERCTAANGQLNLAQCEAPPAGAYIQPIVIIGRRAPVSMNLFSAGAMFSDRIRNGFYTKELEAMVAKLNDPTVTAGEHVAASISVQQRITTASVVSTIAHKLADGLQTVVTKSS
jgi:hypothetical protein